MPAERGQSTKAATPRSSRPQRTFDIDFQLTCGVDDATFQSLKGLIRTQMDEIMDSDKMYRAQRDNLLKLHKQLSDAYPEIFVEDSNLATKLLCVNQYVQKRHGWVRFLIKEQRDKSGRATTPPQSSSSSHVGSQLPPTPKRSLGGTRKSDIIDLRSTTPDSERYSTPDPMDDSPAQDSPMGDRPSGQNPDVGHSDGGGLLDPLDPSIYDGADAPPSQGNRQPSYSSSYSSGLPTFPLPTRPSFRTTSFGQSASSSTPSPRKTSSLVELYSGSSGRDIEGMRLFLKSCTPPMSHFLERFINYGCHSLRFLQAVKRWPKEEIDSFLRDLPLGDASEMTPMEVRILRMHLLSFNFDGKSPQ